MPLFKSSKPAPPPTQPVVQEKHSGGLFSRKRDSHAPATTTTNNTTRTSPTRTGLLHRNNEDPSITAARQRVMNAEQAERDADKALMQARASVRVAREEVKRLEKEAEAEARAAALKQKQAGDISRRAKPLGRHN